MKNFDYDYLFANGNYVGIRIMGGKNVAYFYIYEDEEDYQYVRKAYRSPTLTNQEGTAYVERIIQLDNEGLISAVLFNRDTDLEECVDYHTPKVSPNLVNGMIVGVGARESEDDLEVDEFCEENIAVYCDGKLIYNSGYWDTVGNSCDDVPTRHITTIYGTVGRGCGGFASALLEPNQFVWRNHKYTQWLTKSKS